MEYEVHKCNASDYEIHAIDEIISVCENTIGHNCETEKKFHLNGLDTIEDVALWFDYDGGTGSIVLNYQDKWDVGSIEGFSDYIKKDLSSTVNHILDDIYQDEDENDRVIDEP